MKHFFLVFVLTLCSLHTQCVFFLTHALGAGKALTKTLTHWWNKARLQLVLGTHTSHTHTVPHITAVLMLHVGCPLRRMLGRKEDRHERRRVEGQDVRLLMMMWAM